MFKDFDEYFDCVLSHYGDPATKIDHICRDTLMTRDVVIAGLKKRKMLAEDAPDDRTEIQ